MTRVKGFVRNGGAIINTDVSALDVIKQKRAQKLAYTSLEGQIDQLRKMVIELQGEVFALKSRQEQ